MAGWEILRAEESRGAPRSGLRTLAIIEVSAGAASIVGALLLLAMGVEPVASWFYAFAWWPTIILIDGMNYLLAGDSLILTRRRTFLPLLPLSVTIWVVFEIWNLRMQDWAYLFVPRELPLRWPGMAVAFATVLPAILEIADLLGALRVPRAVGVRPLEVRGPLLAASAGVGIVFLAAPLLAPRYAFPLIWGGFIFLLEPLLYVRGLPSLLREWERGSLLTFVRLLLAGFVAGGLWELFNFWARTKWVYTVPFFEEWKIFEMPVLGFLGFPPFAVECFAMGNAAALAARGARRLPGGAILAVLAPALCLSAFGLIDRRTVVSYAPRLSDLTGVGPGRADRWRSAGVTDLYRFAGTVSEMGAARVAPLLGATEDEVRGWEEEARLMLHAGIGAENAGILRSHGVRTVDDLRALEPAEIDRWLRDAAGRKLRPPRPAIIRLWQ